MSKKMDFREYECELIRVVDGDTIDCWIDLGFKVKWKARVRYMGLDTWESRTRDLEEKAKGLLAKARNKELLEQGTFKLKSFGTGKYGRVLGEVFVAPDFVGEHITECISNPESKIDLTLEGWGIVNDYLKGGRNRHAYDGGKKKVFNG